MKIGVRMKEGKTVAETYDAQGEIFYGRDDEQQLYSNGV